MSEGFWSLRNAPAWWFDKRAWAGIAVMAAILLGSRWYHGPGRGPAQPESTWRNAVSLRTS